MLSKVEHEKKFYNLGTWSAPAILICSTSEGCMLCLLNGPRR